MASRSENPWSERSRRAHSGSGSIRIEEVQEHRLLGLPVSTRIQGGILLVVGLAIVLMGTVLGRWELSAARSDLSDRLAVLARVVAAEAGAEMDERGPEEESVGGSLESLEGAPRVVAARITDLGGRTVERYLRNPLDAERLDLCEGGSGAGGPGRGLLVHRREVMVAGRPAGRLCLVARVPTLGELFLGFGGVFLLASGVLLLVGAVMAWWLARTVTGPASRLTEAVTRVSGSTGASGPLEVVSGDEIGRLTRAVNGLLRKIASREEDLLAAKEEAERASEVKSLFLASMSHELRTPLNGVIGVTDLLAMTPLDREQREYVNTIQASGTALLGVINDILDFSKMESGRMELHPRRFDLEECVRKAVEVTRATGRGKPV
ncbi:MAG: histidine kinase dimerization/phospho-acceptor domain-containing protein, partial [Thermoanaerobaculia bacterium]|nr:histidine kinase dimerization/phospho-acceptor domain-containing protein [Thermoanaerobaculia bacterium]